MREFTRLIPKHKQERWIRKLADFIDLQKEAEYQSVKKGLRKVALLTFPEHVFNEMIEKSAKDKLVVTPLGKVNSSNGFSATIKKAEPGRPFSWVFCITRNYKDGQQFKKLYLKRDDIGIGRMLGYPECCIDYFMENFPIDPVPIWIGTEGEVRGYPEVNGMLRYFGARINSHLSCSPTCKESLKIGKETFKLMQKIDKKTADDLYKLLSSPMTWNSYHGVVQIETPYFIGLANALYLLKKPRIIKWQKIKKPRRAATKKKR